MMVQPESESTDTLEIENNTHGSSPVLNSNKISFNEIKKIAANEVLRSLIPNSFNFLGF